MEDHLSDEQLNEYLDGVLEQQQVRRIDSHLETCPGCTRRLEELQSLFTSLSLLPDEPLQRDLTPAVVAAIRSNRSPAWRGWVMPGLQLAISAVLVAAAWTWLKTRAGLLEFAAPALPVLNPAHAVNLSGLFTTFNTALLQAGETLRAALNTPWLPAWLNSITPGWQPWQAGLLIGAAGLLWLVGNAILFKPTSQNHERRNS